MPNPLGSTDPSSNAALPNQASYDTSTPGVVVDNVTHLMWQQPVPAQMYDWADAQTYCSTLSLAGHDDWRLPSEVELFSLVDFTKTSPGPTVDTTAFPSTPAYYFWSSTPQAGDPSLAWFIYFENGYASSVEVSGSINVRCVRG